MSIKNIITREEEPILKVQNISYEINNTKIVDDISFELPKQEAIVIIGSSGSGKTTLLKLCSGIHLPTAGNILIEDMDINKMDKKTRMSIMLNDIGYIFQDSALISNLNVFDNIALPLRYHNVYKKENQIKAKVEEILEDYNLISLQKRMPASLSLGQAKLVSFARVYVTEPKIIFMDEPTSSIDVEAENKVLEAIRMYLILGGTVVCVTHDMYFANALASQFAVMHDGKMLASGSPSEIKNSNIPTVKRIMKSVTRGEPDLANELLKLMA